MPAGRGPLVGGRCAVSLPSAVPGRIAATLALAESAAAACMRSMRASSELNFCTSSDSSNSCGAAKVWKGGGSGWVGLATGWDGWVLLGGVRQCGGFGWVED